MAVWGIYYELLGFAQQQFVADSIPLALHSSAWGILGIAKNTAYFLGPLLGSAFFERGQKFPLYVAFLFSLISLLVLILSKKSHQRPLVFDIRKVNLFSEIAPQVLDQKKTFEENIIQINSMWIKDATYVRRIIEGMRVMINNKIDTSVYSKTELMAKLEELSVTDEAVD